jgi:hypothetical protein
VVSDVQIKAAGLGPGERRLNGVQTTGRDYRNLSEPDFAMRRTNDVEVAVRDGTVLMADLLQPDGDGCFPALVSFSPYPRQIQDVGAPLGFIEAGASDFFVPRGYAHLIVNARGTGGSGGAWGLLVEAIARNDFRWRALATRTGRGFWEGNDRERDDNCQKLVGIGKQVEQELPVDEFRAVSK